MTPAVAGVSVLPAGDREGTMGANGQPIGESVVYLSLVTAATKLGCSPRTVGRVARRIGAGILADGKKVVAVAVHELPLLKPHVHESAGNPEWIATKGTGPHSRFRKTKRGLQRKPGR